MSRRRNRYRRHNLQPLAGQLRKKSQPSPLQKKCYCNADGFSKLLKFLRKKALLSGPGLGHFPAQKQELKPLTIPKEEIVPDPTPKETVQIVASRINLCYTSRCATNSEEKGLGLLIDCLEAMDWEHTCSHTSGGEKYSPWRSREQMGLSRENVSFCSGDEWRMEWFPGPDMMDLSYESCRE